ncbi:DISP1 [Branchiostoma lanceolatum]|uniref:DISP1 protein n=1 Tax=Branchiostoma lanceolatum TaxID=7740 RepID=A0A8J9ZUE0_BRALA|nr:DISP1 [Branchiostoma lanceolatum]
MGYSKVVADHAFVVFGIAVATLVTCAVVSFTVHQLPNFSDPIAGFEPRGTVLGDRLFSWDNLNDATCSFSGCMLHNIPLKFAHEQQPKDDSHENDDDEDPRYDDDDYDDEEDYRVVRPGVVEDMQEGGRPYPGHVENIGFTASSATAAPPSPDQPTEWSPNNVTVVLDSPGQDFVDVSASPSAATRVTVESRVVSPVGQKWTSTPLTHRPRQKRTIGLCQLNPRPLQVTFPCNNPSRQYARMVFESAGNFHDEFNLFTLPAILSMCSQEKILVRDYAQFPSLCVSSSCDDCCPSWSLGNYVALLQNRQSCSAITKGDVKAVLGRLKHCAGFYHNNTLKQDCWKAGEPYQDRCPRVPAQCVEYNAVHSILHYLVDKDFLSPNQPNVDILRYAMVFVPVASGQAMMDIYQDKFDQKTISDGVTRIVGIDFGIKYTMFEHYLRMDTVYPCIAMAIVIIIIRLYTGSAFITLMTVFTIVSSLVVSYFFYTLVFQFPFFPFMNLTTVILLVGIGADDVFVYCDIWQHSKLERPGSSLVDVVSETLGHAALSMFVTSFTTAATFYANFVSKITAIRCFGVYAGTAILANFILMITLIPSTVVIYEKYIANVCTFKKKSNVYSLKKSCVEIFCDLGRKVEYELSEMSRIFFDKLLPCIVIKYRYVWLVWFVGMMVGGFCVLFVSPGLHLPSQKDFQVFSRSHPFEQYDMVHREQFWFEKAQDNEYAYLPITMIWGIVPKDNGNHLNPDSRGKLLFDDTFDVTSPASQEWLKGFCLRLRNQSFYQPTPGPQLTNCFIELFQQWMDRECVDELTGEDFHPCCNKHAFPYPRDVFNHCIKVATMELDNMPRFRFYRETPGPRFDEKDRIRGLIIEFDSKYKFTLAFDTMDKFYHEVEAWMQGEMNNAPATMSHGWFVSYFDHYALQDNLATGTLIALGLSVAIALAVMFITTLNVLISLYAILSIVGTIVVTVGSLVLLNWELNILESVIMSVAVGLSVDFSVHYGVAYRLAPEKDRESRVIFSLSRMGSAITMAALTTFVAGALMMPSTVLSYVQLGTFLMLVMTISWGYATFFFQSLCRMLGPEGNCCHISVPACHLPCDGMQIVKSDSSHQPTASVTYEMEPLTSQKVSRYRHSGNTPQVAITTVNGSLRLPPKGRAGSKLPDQLTIVGVRQNRDRCEDKDLNMITILQNGQSSRPRLKYDDASEGDNQETVPNHRSNVSDIWVPREGDSSSQEVSR